MEEAEITARNPAVKSWQTSSLQVVVSKKIILLPCTFSAEEADWFSHKIKKCGSLKVLVCLMVRKEHANIDNNDGIYAFPRTGAEKNTDDKITPIECIVEL